MLLIAISRLRLSAASSPHTRALVSCLSISQASGYKHPGYTGSQCPGRPVLSGRSEGDEGGKGNATPFEGVDNLSAFLDGHQMTQGPPVPVVNILFCFASLSSPSSYGRVDAHFTSSISGCFTWRMG